MKVAILGASGIVGRSLASFLTEKRIEWVGTYNTNPFEGGIQLQAAEKDTIKELFETHKVTHCVNCIAQRNVDVCEKQWDSTVDVNCTLAKHVAAACLEKNIYFVHISTDYVFDGSSPPYLPTTQHCPIQAYGKSKSLAEQAIVETNPSASILRVPVLYTQRYTTINETAVTMIGKKVMDLTKQHIEDNYYIRRPVYIDDFCAFIYDCLKEEKSSTFHFYNSQDKTTKYGIATLIGKYLERSTAHITPQIANTHQAGRPYDTQLQDPQYERRLYPDTSLEQGIASCFNQFKHPPLKKGDAPLESVFYMIDLDGTLLHTDRLHYDAYQKAFSAYGKDICSWEDYQGLVSFETYAKETLGPHYDGMKQEKQAQLYKLETIEFIAGAEDFLTWLLNTQQNFVIVTNTTRSTVDFFKTKVPLLRRIHQWITREDVTAPKPSGEPYRLAIERFSKGEPYVLGIENTITGFKSLKEVTSIIYLVSTETPISKVLYEKDAYFIKNLTEIFTDL
jgi:S-adenosylmethionine synthetase